MTKKQTITAGLAALTLAGIAVPGATAGTPATPPPADPADEAALQAAEARVLGASHAAEHAQLRQAIRQRKATGSTAASSAPLARASVGLRPVTADPRLVGRWGAAFPIPVMAVHGAVLPTGKVLWFSYPRKPTGSNTPGVDISEPNLAHAWLWDPRTGAHKQVDPPLWRDPADGQLKPANIWCAGQSHMVDGRLLVTGGNLAFGTKTSAPKGLNKVYTFNPFTETWAEQPDMRAGRWYPTNVLLPDGRTVIMSGLTESGVAGANDNKLVELFTPSANLNGRGRISLLGRRGTKKGPPTGGLYPHTIPMPSGRILITGPLMQDSWFMKMPGPDNAFSWKDIPNLRRDRVWGTAVPVPAGPDGSPEVLQLGGSAPGSYPPNVTAHGVVSAETFDERRPRAGWRAAPSMQVGRSHHNTVLLPDGSMVTVGGGVGVRSGNQWAADPEQRHIELWNPSTRRWTLGPAQAEPRAYHSIAMLLPDARVISAGDDLNTSIFNDTAEIYEPPYLFKGPRPVIRSTPARITLGKSFSVSYSGASVRRAALVAPSAVTHANDMSQRYVPLRVERRSGGAVRLTAPPNTAVAGPGYYMLFLVSDRGVPSVSRFLQLGRGGCLDGPRGVAGTELGVAKLGRTRASQRRHSAPGRRRSGRSIDLWCTAGGGALRVGYPTRRLERALGSSGRRRLHGRVAFALTTSPQTSLRGVKRGHSARSAARRLRGERRHRVGRSTWLVAPGGKVRLLVRVVRGKVVELGISDRRATAGSKRAESFLRAWTLR